MAHWKNPTFLHYAWTPGALWKLKSNTDSYECTDSFPFEDRPLKSKHMMQSVKLEIHYVQVKIHICI